MIFKIYIYCFYSIFVYFTMNVLTVVSYNIWFDETLRLERTVSLIQTIYNLNPDVICLQEVIPDMYEILINQLSNYRFHFPKKINKDYGTVTLSKYPISKCLDFEYKNSKMGRSLIITKIDYPYHKQTADGIAVEKLDIVIANSHFESLFKRATENETKIEQYVIAQKMLENLYTTYENVILCADTNVMLHENEKLNSIFDTWSDAWKLKGSNLNDYTYDSETNIYLKIKLVKFVCRSRIDRIIFKTNNCVLEEFNAIKANQDCIEPSDHYGIISKFLLKK
jgi:tyrosyl-DNA phosphodiesterase 2